MEQYMLCVIKEMLAIKSSCCEAGLDESQNVHTWWQMSFKYFKKNTALFF